MTPPIFQVCYANSGVQAVLSETGGRLRLYPFGEAPQDDSKPYAVWQVVSGQPENYLGQTPDIDYIGVQVDVYALQVSDAREVAIALRNAIEPVAHIVRWDGEWREPQTKFYRVAFTIDWFTDR